MLNRLSRRYYCTGSPRPWLFVGLGNPGDKYKGTRHNVGFEMIDAFANSQGISMDTVHCKGVFGQGFVGEVPVLLAKPQTDMNLSGESDHLLHRVLVAEECDLSLSWEQRISSAKNRPREASGSMDPKAFLLQKFNATAKGRTDAALQEGVDMLKVVLSKVFAESARRFNSEQKYKHLRLEAMPT